VILEQKFNRERELVEEEYLKYLLHNSALVDNERYLNTYNHTYIKKVLTMPDSYGFNSDKIDDVYDHIHEYMSHYTNVISYKEFISIRRNDILDHIGI